jgi:hypothetical protein
MINISNFSSVPNGGIFMKLNTLMIITAIIAFIFGLGFILAPVWTLQTYGVSTDVTCLFMSRYFGAAILGYAFLAWLTRNTASKGVQAGFFAAMVLGFVIAVYNAFSGVSNALVWLNVVVYLLLGIGFGYFVFIKKD